VGRRDPRVDEYIAKSADFAKPILRHIRTVVHSACPDVEETLKWRAPAFEHAGLLCQMAAFKEHATLGFWKAALILGDRGQKGGASWGNFGRLTSVADLPAKKVLVGYVKRAVALNESGVKAPRAMRSPKKPPRVPADFTAALARAKRAREHFAGFSPSHQREYVEWITEAKQAATRERRIAQALAWIAEGKSRNWKYEKC